MTVTGSPNLLKFNRKEIRRKKGSEKPSAKAFPKDKTERANRFAKALCLDLDLFLRQYGMMTAHEEDSEYLGPLAIEGMAESIKTRFTIRTDIHILTVDSFQHIANLEVKYMPAGMIRYDAKKIAYQFMHLRKQYPKQRNFIVSGGKFIQNNSSIVHLLKTFSDGFFQLLTESYSNKISQSFEVFCKEILLALNKKRKRYGIIPSRHQPSILAPFSSKRELSSNLSTTDCRNHNQKKRDGYAFEGSVATILESMGIQYAPKKTVDVSIFSKHPIFIELDFAISDNQETGVAIECKNSAEIDTKTACNIAFDSIMLKRKYPNAIYLLVLGPNNEKCSSPHLRRYVDYVLTIDDLPRFIKKRRHLLE